MKRYELTNTKPLAYEPDYRMVEDADGEYVLYSEAEARVKELEAAIRNAENDMHHYPSCAFEGYGAKCDCGLEERREAAQAALRGKRHTVDAQAEQIKRLRKIGRDMADTLVRYNLPHIAAKYRARLKEANK